MKATAIANANIALVKYWGRDENLIPYNPSFAVTLDEQLHTKTTVEFSDKFNEDEFVFNGKKQSGIKLDKVVLQLYNIRKKAGVSFKAKVFSENSFPHSAGLAASTSGFAALTGAGCKALGMDLSREELSTLISTSPSGSATRSVFGGFVEYDNKKNIAVRHYSPEYWPELRNIISIVDKSEKRINSNEGMLMTVNTSILYKKRIEKSAANLIDVINALKEKNPSLLYKTIMRESNNLHAVMLDTWPPLFYLNDISKEIIYAVHELNKNKIICGYTFDAGPNAHIFTTEEYVEKIILSIKKIKGIKEFKVCRPGKGIRYTEEHLF